MDPNQDNTNDTGVTTPTPTTDTDQPTVGDQTPPVVPADKPVDQPVDQPAVTPDPASTIPEPAKPTETPDLAPTTPEPIKEEGEGTSGTGTPPAA